MTGVDKCRVIAVITCLEVSANKGLPRGSIADFSLLECAGGLRIPPEEVRLIYLALEELGWIDREYLSTWDERQPDKEDTTVKERMVRYRKRKKEVLKQQFEALRRNTVTVTPKTQTSNITSSSFPTAAREERKGLAEEASKRPSDVSRADFEAMFGQKAARR